MTTDPRYAGLGLDAARVCNTRLTTLTGANPDLQPEKSKTYTVGFVVEPVKNFMASVDFWKIDMKGTIAQIDEDDDLRNPAKYNSCSCVTRTARLQYITKTRLNMGGLKTQGIDIEPELLAADRRTGARFGASLDGTYTDKYEGQNEVGSAWIDCVGRVGRARHRLDLGEHLHLQVEAQGARELEQGPLHGPADAAVHRRATKTRTRCRPSSRASRSTT